MKIAKIAALAAALSIGFAAPAMAGATGARPDGHSKHSVKAGHHKGKKHSKKAVKKHSSKHAKKHAAKKHA